MVCTKCGVFTGPVCGACRALGRINSVLQGGLLLHRHEQVVVETLRQTAGILSDLAEEGFAERETRRRLNEEHKEGLRGRTSRPQQPPREVKREKTPSEYTYETSEEEAAEQEDKGRKEGGGPGGGVKPPEPDHPPRGHPDSGSSSRKAPPVGPAAVKPDPRYLSKALSLKPAAKASTEEGRPSRKSEKEWDRPKPDPKHRGHHGGAEEEEAERSLGVSRVPDDRKPLARRKQDKDPQRKRRRRGSGGVKKRQRGQNWKEFLEWKNQQK